MDRDRRSLFAAGLVTIPLAASSAQTGAPAYADKAAVSRLVQLLVCPAACCLRERHQLFECLVPKRQANAAKTLGDRDAADAA
jgi:hypothetical protein